jgi:hypothetical protein
LGNGVGVGRGRGRVEAGGGEGGSELHDREEVLVESSSRPFLREEGEKINRLRTWWLSWPHILLLIVGVAYELELRFLAFQFELASLGVWWIVACCFCSTMAFVLLLMVYASGEDRAGEEEETMLIEAEELARGCWEWREERRAGGVRGSIMVVWLKDGWRSLIATKCRCRKQKRVERESKSWLGGWWLRSEKRGGSCCCVESRREESSGEGSLSEVERGLRRGRVEPP